MTRERRQKRGRHTVDVVLLTPVEGELALLLRRAGEGRERWVIPWDAPGPDETLGAAAARVARSAAGVTPMWIEQVCTFGDDKRHPSEAALSVAYAALLPLGMAEPAGSRHTLCRLSELPSLAPRQHQMVDAALAAMRDRMDTTPVAFRLLPPAFTLSELQQMYELLLGRRLHKASFRRSLQAALLVEPTDEWRGEGRGRPAQLYRYAPKKRRRGRRGVRFDIMGN